MYRLRDHRHLDLRHLMFPGITRSSQYGEQLSPELQSNYVGCNTVLPSIVHCVGGSKDCTVLYFPYSELYGKYSMVG